MSRLVDRAGALRPGAKDTTTPPRYIRNCDTGQGGLDLQSTIVQLDKLQSSEAQKLFDLGSRRVMAEGVFLVQAMDQYAAGRRQAGRWKEGWRARARTPIDSTRWRPRKQPEGNTEEKMEKKNRKRTRSAQSESDTTT